MKREFLLFRILAKRILRRKSVWVTLLLTVCVTAALVKLEKNSSAVIYAAVCTKDETLAAHLAEHEGLVRFVLCEDEEEVKRNVIKGEAECGYVLQEDLQKEIAAGRGNWSIEVWAGSDSAMTPVVNEILFETIFTEIATDWYAGYIAEHPAFQNTVERRRSGAGSGKSGFSGKTHGRKHFHAGEQPPGNPFGQRGKRRGLRESAQKHLSRESGHGSVRAALRAYGRGGNAAGQEKRIFLQTAGIRGRHDRGAVYRAGLRGRDPDVSAGALARGQAGISARRSFSPLELTDISMRYIIILNLIFL